MNPVATTQQLLQNGSGDYKEMEKAVAQEEKVVLVEKEGPLAWIKLNRPKVHNCLSRQVLNDIIKACQELSCDKTVRVVAIIGSGMKVFCAGADLQERKGMSEGDTIDYIALIQKTMCEIESLPQPVIAAINGSAFGGGTELALACDLRVMVSDASLRLTEVKLGIIPGAGGTQRLPRLIGEIQGQRNDFDCPANWSGRRQNNWINITGYSKERKMKLWNRAI